MLFISDNKIKIKYMISPINLLGNMSEKEFTQKFWGKKSCHIESVIEIYSESISKKYLINLIKDERLFTKLITQNKSNYITKFGPLAKQSINNKDPFTLLIHKFQHWHKFSYDLFNSIKFIPFFRHDDVMISFSNMNGSVGPHSDSYDVFLFQGSGEKTWTVGQPHSKKIKNSKLNIKQNIKGQFKFIAKPGDVIYIPPNTLHHGVANTDDCITYSIGLRSPSNHDIKQRYLEFLMDEAPEDIDIYNGSKDHSLNIFAKLPTQLIKFINEKCKSILKNNSNSIFIGQFMSEPDLDITFIKKKYVLRRLVDSNKERILYFDVASRGVYFDKFFFINGVHISINKSHSSFFKDFFDNKKCLFYFNEKNPDLEKIIIGLLNDGFIHFKSPKFLV